MSEIVIFGRKGCPYTEEALEKVASENRKHTFIQVPSCPDDNMCKLFRMLAIENDHKTVPCIFEVSYIGGFDDFKNK